MFGMGLGWSLALFSLKAHLSTIPIFLLSTGFITLLAASGVFFWRSKLNLSGFQSRSAIDIRDSIRAFRIHGAQVPLINRHSFRTEMICLSRKDSVLLPDNHRFIVEHWAGPGAQINLKSGALDLDSEQILYFDSSQLEKWEKGKMRLAIVPIDIRADEDLVLLLHIIPQEV